MDGSTDSEIATAEIVDAEIVAAEVLHGQIAQHGHRSRLRLSIVGIGILAFVGLGAYVIVTGLQEDANKVAAMVRDHPILIEQLGGIDECRYNYGGSLGEGGKRTDIFDVRGPKGTGQFETYELFFKIRSIILRTESGEWELLDAADAGHVNNER